MFSKLLNNILGSQGKKNKKLEYKIANMDLPNMRLYVNGKLDAFKVDAFGLNEIVKKLTHENKETSKHFMQDDDMDSKKKKVLDLIVLILANKKTSITVIESIHLFLDVYEELIKKYDTDNKQIYEKRIKDLINLAIKRIEIETNIITIMEMAK